MEEASYADMDCATALIDSLSTCLVREWWCGSPTNSPFSVDLDIDISEEWYLYIQGSGRSVIRFR